MRTRNARALGRSHSALVLVDYQARLMPAIEQGEAAVQEALFLARVAHAMQLPVIGTEQNPQGLGPNDLRVREACDATLAKMHFDACADGLLDVLGRGGRDVRQVVIAGCETHVCLLQTALGLLRAGLDVFVVAAGCGSRRPEDKALALARLAQAGAVPVNGEMVAFEWLGTCEAQAFKTVLQLVKSRGAA
jgi:nicotinamidase-related amidase